MVRHEDEFIHHNPIIVLFELLPAVFCDPPE